MTIALVLVLGALLVAWVAPGLLERRLAAGADPQISLVTWASLVASTLGSLASAAGLVLLPDHGPARQVVARVHDCWAALSHGAAPRLDVIAALLSVLLVAIAGVRCSTSLVRHMRQRRKLHRKHVHLLRILTGSEAVAGSTLWLDVPHLMAYSLAGRPALVVASDGLRRRLPREAVAAVLEHERAHLRGRHHLLVAIAEALAVALPWLPLMRRSPALVRALVEISADSAAARSHGSGAVRAALLTMSAVSPAPAATLGMAPDGLTLRLSVLSAQRTEHSRVQRTLRSGLAGTIAMLLPPFASILILTTATAVFCAG